MPTLADPSRYLAQKKREKVQKIQIGFYTKDGIFPPTPGMSRAVRETVDLLKEAGHEVSEKPLLIICFDPLAGGGVDATMPGSYLQRVA